MSELTVQKTKNAGTKRLLEYTPTQARLIQAAKERAKRRNDFTRSLVLREKRLREAEKREAEERRKTEFQKRMENHLAAQRREINAYSDEVRRVRRILKKQANEAEIALMEGEPTGSTKHRIACEVCVKHGITLEELRFGGRQQRFVIPRAEFFYRAREEIGSSWPEMAQWCGGKDHATAIHGYRKHVWRMEQGLA